MKKDDEKSVASSDGKVENGMRTERSGDRVGELGTSLGHSN